MVVFLLTKQSGGKYLILLGSKNLHQVSHDTYVSDVAPPLPCGCCDLRGVGDTKIKLQYHVHGIDYVQGVADYKFYDLLEVVAVVV